MKVLDLPLKGKWYDMEEAGEKPEEYRDTLFWAARLLNVDREGYGYFTKACHGDFEDLKCLANDSCKEFTLLLKQAIADGYFEYRHYDAVRLHRGYTNTTMLFKCEGITIGKGNPDWGAPEEEVFIIKLGERI